MLRMQPRGHKRPECPYRREGNQRYATRGRGYNVRFRRDSGYSPRRTNDTRARTDTSTERSRTDRDKHVNSTGEGSIYATLVVNGQSQTCLIDCGSEISIIPEELATGLEREESDKVLLAANSTQISQLGEVIVKVEIGEHTTTSKMLVSDQVESIILGLDWLMTNKGRIDFETCVLTVKGIDIQLHHSEPRQQFYSCPRIRMKKSSKSNYVIKRSTDRKEIRSRVNKPNLVVKSDATETDQPRCRGTPDDVRLEGQVPEMVEKRSKEQVKEESKFLQNKRERNRRPRRRIQKPGRYKDSVRCRNDCQAGQTGEQKSGRVRPAPRRPIPRKCKFCDLQLEGRQDQRRHVQDVHEDILARNREQARKKRQLTEEDDQIRVQVGSSGIRRVQVGSSDKRGEGPAWRRKRSK